MTLAVLSSNDSRPPLYRLHFSSWLMFAFGLLVAVIVEVPGNDSRNTYSGAMVLESGWPAVYIERVPDWSSIPPANEFATIWNPTEAVEHFRAWPLVLD